MTANPDETVCPVENLEVIGSLPKTNTEIIVSLIDTRTGNILYVEYTENLYGELKRGSSLHGRGINGNEVADAYVEEELNRTVIPRDEWTYDPNSMGK